MLKITALFLAVVYSIGLTLISLVKLNHVPDIGVSFGDKIFHFLAYLVLTFLWFLAYIHHFKLEKRISVFYAAIFSVFFGIIIEVLQNMFTTYRTLDIYDLLANLFGVTTASIIIVLKK